MKNGLKTFIVLFISEIIYICILRVPIFPFFFYFLFSCNKSWYIYLYILIENFLWFSLYHFGICGKSYGYIFLYWIWNEKDDLKHLYLRNNLHCKIYVLWAITKRNYCSNKIFPSCNDFGEKNTWCWNYACMITIL